MEIRVFIVSLACLSCLVPPALAKSLVVKAATVAGAKSALAVGLKGAAIGVGVGLAAKGAVALVAKKALMGILLKAAALKGAALIGKKALIKGAGALALQGFRSELAKEMASTSEDSSESDCQTTSTTSPIRDIIRGSAQAMQSTIKLGQAAAQKYRAIYKVMSAVPGLVGPTLGRMAAK